MEYRKVLAVLSIAGVSGVTALAEPPKTQQPPKDQPTTAEQREAPRTEQRDGARIDGHQRTVWKNGDHFLASCVAIENQEEVALGRWAEEKLQSPEAKEFARMLVKDHSDFLTKLQQFAPETTGENFLTSAGSTQRPEGQQRDDREKRNRSEGAGSNKEGVRDPAQPAPRPEATTSTNTAEKQLAGTRQPNEAGNMDVDLMQLHREIAEQCLAVTKEMLGKKSDQELDACFVGLQIAKHAAMKTKLEVYQRHATGKLKELLAQGESVTANHLEHAEKLMKQLEGSSTRTAEK